MGFGVQGLGLRRGARPVLHLKRPHPPILKKKGGVGAFQRACVLIMNCFPAPLCGRRFLFFPPRAAFAGGPSLPFFLLGFRLAPLNSLFFFCTVFLFKGFGLRVFAGRTPENAPRRGTAMTPEIGKSAGGSHDHGCSHPLREANPPFRLIKTMVLKYFLPRGHPETEKSAGERYDPHPLREANPPFS